MTPFDSSPTLRSGASHDVIIVGGRAAGAATAMLLAKRGLRTLLLERAAFGSDTLSTHALMRAGVLQLARWRLLDEIVDAGTPAIHRGTFQYGEQRVVIDIKPSHGVDALYAPRRTVLDPILVRAAVDAGVDVHFGTSVTDLMWRGRSAVGVRAVTPDGRNVELRAPLVIGADGIRSTIARHARARFSRVGRHVSATTYGYWSDIEVDGYTWIFRPGACSGVIPTNDGQVCVFASADTERIGRGGIDLITDVVAVGDPDMAERLRAATPPRGTRTWIGHHGFLRRAHGPGWALVGDAGYYKDPISAHGISDALRDAELLARAVIDGLGSEATLVEALAEYELTRDRLSIPLFEVVDRIASHEWDDAEIAVLLRQLSAAVDDEVETLAGLEPEPVS